MKEVEILKSIAEAGKNSTIDIVKRRYTSKLSPELNNLYREMQEKGFVIVPDFMTAQQCEEIKSWMDTVITTNPKIWKDSVESDNRIFFSNTASPQIDNFYTNKNIIDVLSVYEKTRNYQGFTLANKLVYKDDNAGSGGGWHRDFVKRKQTKALLYLSDVTEKNGSFQFISKTHIFKNILKFQKEFGFRYNQFRFTNEEIERVVTKYPELLQTITGKAGTLILVDTRGIHRGKPVMEGTRYALTNYYWFGGSIPAHIKKLNPFK